MKILFILGVTNFLWGLVLGYLRGKLKRTEQMLREEQLLRRTQFRASLIASVQQPIDMPRPDRPLRTDEVDPEVLREIAAREFFARGRGPRGR